MSMPLFAHCKVTPAPDSRAASLFVVARVGTGRLAPRVPSWQFVPAI